MRQRIVTNNDDDESERGMSRTGYHGNGATRE